MMCNTQIQLKWVEGRLGTYFYPQFINDDVEEFTTRCEIYVGKDLLAYSVYRNEFSFARDLFGSLAARKHIIYKLVEQNIENADKTAAVYNSLDDVQVACRSRIIYRPLGAEDISSELNIIVVNEVPNNNNSFDTMLVVEPLDIGGDRLKVLYRPHPRASVYAILFEKGSGRLSRILDINAVCIDCPDLLKGVSS